MRQSETDDHTTVFTEDEDVFQSLAHAFVDKFQSMNSTKCSNDIPSGVVHGADLPAGAVAMADTLYSQYRMHMVCSVIILSCFFVF